MAHQLKIGIEDILQDAKYIRAIDWSVYDQRMSVTNRVMKVEIPGIADFKLVPFPMNDSITYSSKSLKLAKTLENLPDGFWVFTYSICPNERKFTVFNHFRTVQLEAKLMGSLAKLMGTESYTEEIQMLINTCCLNIQALKANSIDKYNVQKAYDLYNETERIYSNIHKKVEYAL